MKGFPVAFFVVCLVVCSHAGEQFEFSESTKAQEEICIKETNCMKELVQKSLEGQFAEDENLKCFWRCMYASFDMISESGEIEAEAMKEHIPRFVDKAKAEKVIEQCRHIKGSESCEIAFNLAKCHYKKAQE